MSKRFFDYDDGDFARSISDHMAIDSDGDLGHGYGFGRTPFHFWLVI